MPHQIFVISDGTGRTAEQALKAALTQFENTEVQVNIRPNVRTEQQVSDIIFEARMANGLVVHTVVLKKIRDMILDQSRLHDVDTIDVMGPLLAQLSHHFAYTPSEKPGVFHELNKSYFQRIEAVEFAIRHDDGQKTEELENAEIVVLGVSRTFKTPVSIYLAFKGWLVANIPIILGIDMPDILSQLPPERIVCLTTIPKNLAELRRFREIYLGGATGEYAKLSYIRGELSYAHRLCKKNPKWSVVDVTNKPIEEISEEIMTALRKKSER
jgi:regulator of PEP synthase PpsR (kinase-PPPase family)